MDPWSIRSDNNREADQLTTFIIFCEDEVSEVLYFRFFETSLTKINILGGKKSKNENVVEALTHCLDQGLIVYENDQPKLIGNSPIVWCVFDRDLEPEGTNHSKGNISFTKAIADAQRSGIKVAWSNDSFELWVLLHFEDVDPTIQENKSRETYYNRLTEIFKNLSNPNEYLLRLLEYRNFNYKTNLKTQRGFLQIVRDQLIKCTDDAISRATSLEKYHAETIPYHDKSPCTLVHHLVIELIEAGQEY